MGGEALAMTHFPHTILDAQTTTTPPWDVNEATTSTTIWTMFHATDVTRVGIHITVDIVYGTTPTAAVIGFFKRVTYASDTGIVEIGRVTLPLTGAVAGQVYYVDIPPASGEAGINGQFLTGQQLVAKPIVLGVGGTATGNYNPVWFGNPGEEPDKNQVNAAGTQMLVLDITTLQLASGLAEAL